MATYHFVTDLRVGATRQQVWSALNDVPEWTSWWRWLTSVDVLDAGDTLGVGARYRLGFKTALPYTLRFETTTVRVDPQTRIESRAAGELAGLGLWELSGSDDVTAARYTWIVETTKAWMNLLAPIARPAFSWNHDRLMRDFATGLAGHLGAELLSVNNSAVKPSAPSFGTLPEAAPS